MRIVFALFLVACSATAPSPSRVRGYEFALEKSAPFPAPYLARFERREKTLLFVAAAHRSDSTYRTVREAFRSLRPQAVVVEGVRARNLADETSVRKYVLECEKSGFGDNCGESWVALAEALRTGAEYAAGEPDDTAVLDDIRRQGFTDEDLQALFLAREIPQRSGDFKPWAERRLREIHRSLPAAAPFSFADFENWYARHGKPGTSAAALTTDDVAPADGNDLQKISHAVTVARDRQVVRVAASLLKRLDRVLIVYGASHLLTEFPAFEDALGRPRYEKTF